MKKILLALTLLSGLAACGGPEEAPANGMRISFVEQRLQCDSGQGLKAQLEASTMVNQACQLEVGADRSVTGTCQPIDAGDIVQFRLVYYYQHPSGEIVELASALLEVDLRDETRERVAVDFSQATLMSDRDDDSDGRNNIVEWCAGTDPRVRD